MPDLTLPSLAALPTAPALIISQEVVKTSQPVPRKSRYSALSDEVNKAAAIVIQELESIDRVKCALSDAEKQVLKLAQELEIERGKVILSKHETEGPSMSDIDILRKELESREYRIKALELENQNLRKENEDLIASTNKKRKDEEVETYTKYWRR